MPVYLDHNATTPLSETAAIAMRPYLQAGYHGNPMSRHQFGQEAAGVVDRARNTVLGFLGVDDGTVVFTGSGTEAIALALTGLAAIAGPSRRHLVVSAVEHPAVLDCADQLAERGLSVTRVAPDADGVIHPEAVQAALREETAAVAVMQANNETGVLMPIPGIARVCRERGIPLLVDSVQAAGKIPVEARVLGADLLVLASHKLGGPAGVAALWIRSGLSLTPLIPGSQEGGLRGGTQFVAGIAGFAAALVEAGDPGRLHGLVDLQKRLEERVGYGLPGARVTGGKTERLPNTTHFTFDPEVGEDLAVALDLMGFAVSSGAACRSGSDEPSHVLLAMGMDPARTRTAIRISLGPGNTTEEVDAFAEAVVRACRKAREVSS